jgi:DNA-binding LacI/PurR family transcriptional regulator
MLVGEFPNPPYHDLIAEEVIRRIKSINLTHNRNYHIPEDIAIIGFDNLPIATSITPALSTIAY